jgi:hypothetical protein
VRVTPQGCNHTARQGLHTKPGKLYFLLLKESAVAQWSDSSTCNNTYVSNQSAYACIRQCTAHCTHESNPHTYVSACYTSGEGPMSTAQVRPPPLTHRYTQQGHTRPGTHPGMTKPRPTTAAACMVRQVPNLSEQGRQHTRPWVPGIPVHECAHAYTCDKDLH